MGTINFQIIGRVRQLPRGPCELYLNIGYIEYWNYLLLVL